LPGWPISREEMLGGNLHEAQEILDIAGKNESVDVADSDPSLLKQPGFDSPLFNKASSAQSPPTRFFEKYGEELKQSSQIDVFYNANVFDLTLSDNLVRAKSVRVQNYNGQISEIYADQYVLALGGIENVRILLNADHQIPAGIGNHSGMVGRCFMDSLDVPIGRFLVTDPNFWQLVRVNLVPTETLMRESDVGSGIVTYTPNMMSSAALKSFGRLKVLREFIHQTGCLWPSMTELARKIVDFNCPGDGVITSTFEQEPNPASRVTLIDEVDSLGLRRVQLNWQLGAGDLKTIRILSIESAKEMARLNRARVQLSRFILDAELEIPVEGFGHHMGTTRMSADPRYGVVDENCRVHGIRNLYIAGSSVFPICGGRNPTLTIVLLSLRLANFLSDIGPVE
jgi:choline dehydrogenase-like flavoprotein